MNVNPSNAVQLIRLLNKQAVLRQYGIPAPAPKDPKDRKDV